MIDIEDVENHILTNTNQKMISCLRLSGFNSFIDYTIFNETTVLWIEKYVGIRCSLLPPEERLTFIDGEFINSPETYMFSVPVRQRLLKSVFELQNESEKLMQTLRDADVLKNDDMKSPSPLDESDNVDDASDVVSVKSQNELRQGSDLKADVEIFETICRRRAVESIPENQRKFYNEVIQFASEEFIECYLVPFSDFNLTLPDFSAPNLRVAGRYHCLICSLKKRSTFAFKFRQDLKIQFTKIKKHLMEHFTVNPDASDIRKQSRNIKRKECRKRKIDNDCVILGQVPAKKFVQENKQKTAALLNEIMNGDIIEISSVKESCPKNKIHSCFSPSVMEREQVIVTDFPSVCDPILTESVEVVIEPAASDDNQKNSDCNLSESDAEESNLTICL